MEARVSMITLGVADLARARRFYETLGFEVRPESAEGVVFMQLNGFWLSLFGREDLAHDIGCPAHGEGFRAFTLAHNVRTREAVAAVMAEAQAAGARILKPAQDTFWGGHAGYFADPDGHVWEIAWNPHFWIA